VPSWFEHRAQGFDFPSTQVPAQISYGLAGSDEHDGKESMEWIAVQPASPTLETKQKHRHVEVLHPCTDKRCAEDYQRAEDIVASHCCRLKDYQTGEKQRVFDTVRGAALTHGIAVDRLTFTARTMHRHQQQNPHHHIASPAPTGGARPLIEKTQN